MRMIADAYVLPGPTRPSGAFFKGPRAACAHPGIIVWLLKPLILCTILCALMGPVRAADLGETNLGSRANLPAAMHVWSGPYAGVEFGLSQTANEAEANGAKTDFGRTDAAFGVFAGHNWEVAMFVLGIEAGAAYLGGDGKSTLSGVGGVKGGSHWTATFRGRAGVPIGNFMPYLSAGIGATDYTFEANGKKRSNVTVSPVVGAGLEMALHQDWKVRADYSLTGVMWKDKADFNGTTISRKAANHRLMLGISRSF